MMDRRVVLFTNNSWEGEALAQRIVAEGLHLRFIVREEHVERIPYSSASRLARSVVGHAMVDRIGRLRLDPEVRATRDWEVRRFKQAEQLARAERKQRGYSVGWPKDVPFMITSSVNTPDVVQRVTAEHPALIIVFGTHLLGRALLSIPKKGAINAHSSILPHYKGPRSEFWQCLDNDPRYAGITIHQVTPHVDDGAILFQRPAQCAWPTDPFHLRTLNTIAVLEHMPRVAKDHLEGRTQPVTQGTTDTPVRRFKDVTMERRIDLMKLLTSRVA